MSLLVGLVRLLAEVLRPMDLLLLLLLRVVLLLADLLAGVDGLEFLLVERQLVVLLLLLDPAGGLLGLRVPGSRLGKALGLLGLGRHGSRLLRVRLLLRPGLLRGGLLQSGGSHLDLRHGLSQRQLCLLLLLQVLLLQLQLVLLLLLDDGLLGGLEGQDLLLDVVGLGLAALGSNGGCDLLNRLRHGLGGNGGNGWHGRLAPALEGQDLCLGQRPTVGVGLEPGLLHGPGRLDELLLRGQRARL